MARYRRCAYVRVVAATRLPNKTKPALRFTGEKRSRRLETRIQIVGCWPTRVFGNGYRPPAYESPSRCSIPLGISFGQGAVWKTREKIKDTFSDAERSGKEGGEREGESRVRWGKRAVPKSIMRNLVCKSRGTELLGERSKECGESECETESNGLRLDGGAAPRKISSLKISICKSRGPWPLARLHRRGLDLHSRIYVRVETVE